MPFYNTTDESTEQTLFYTKKTKKQEILVFEIATALKTFSVSDIYKKYPIAATPITSIRRSINTLKNRFKIQETGKKRTSIYGRAEIEYTIPVAR